MRAPAPGLKIRRAYVRDWKGPPPAVGDQLRSTAARYLILAIKLHPNGTPARFTLTRVKFGQVEGGTTHAWVWSGRGRARTR